MSLDNIAFETTKCLRHAMAKQPGPYHIQQAYFLIQHWVLASLSVGQDRRSHAART